MDLSNGEKLQQSDIDLLSLPQNKANILSGTTIPMFCDLFWEVTVDNKELVQSLCETMSEMYQNGQHKEMLTILRVLYELLEMEMPEEILVLAKDLKALDEFLKEMLLDFDDAFGELLTEF